jgi:GGDEF domain-containing protein
VNPGPPRRRRARPVADAPVDELLARTDDLAKGWLLALIEQVPLEDAASILAGGLASDGPRICAAALRAIADDRDLRRLEPGGVLEPLVSACGAFGGEAGPAAVLTAVEALHAVLWSALRAELRDPEPDLVYDVAARLDAVCELVRVAAVSRQARERGTAHLAPVVPEVPADAAADAGLVDPEARPIAPEAGPETEVPPGMDEADLPPPTPLRPVFSATARRDRDEVLWVAALEEEVARSRRSGAGLSLLLVELEDGDRIAQSELGAEGAAAFGRFPQAVRSVLRRQDLLASEAQSRVWVIARDTARPGARALADRIAAAVSEVEGLHGAPLTVNVGLAVLGEDAHDCSSLLEAAEEAAFTAAAVGDRVAEYLPQSRSGEPPGTD